MEDAGVGRERKKRAAGLEGMGNVEVRYMVDKRINECVRRNVKISKKIWQTKKTDQICPFVCETGCRTSKKRNRRM